VEFIRKNAMLFSFRQAHLPRKLARRPGGKYPTATRAFSSKAKKKNSVMAVHGRPWKC